MPLAQLFTSGIEVAFNQLLKLDADSHTRLQKLRGRSLQVTVRELPWPLLFSFSDQIDVRAIEMTSAETETADCTIELNIQTLPSLQDSSQLTQLIQQQKLLLVGDIYVAQTFSTLIKDLDIDWEEQLAQYTGDVVAHQTFSSIKSVFNSARSQMQQTASDVGARLTQEDAIAVTPNEVSQFSLDVNDLRGATERLSARLALLERANQPDTGSHN